MTSRKLDELSADIDDASMVVEELQDDPDADSDEKLDELSTLKHAADTIEEIVDEGTKE